jgi:competence protein ComK
MFLLPVEYGSRIFTHVFEVDDEFISPFKPLEIVKNSCDYYGSDYESRKRSTHRLIKYSRKLPIAIEPTFHIFFFPTASPDRQDCIWINSHFIEEFHRVAPQKTRIKFKNNQTYEFPVPYTTIESQILRTSLLKTKLIQRIQSNERNFNYSPQKIEGLKASEHSDQYRSFQNMEDRD